MKSTLPNARKYPKFIRENKTVKKYAGQERVWSKIGLDNCSKKIKGGKRVVFSGSGKTALWDIATMSMRGIDSCQRWQSRRYSGKLVGSMIDPYVGIIYITDGKRTSHGKKMLHRAVVRFIVKHKTNKPAIMIERVYYNWRESWTKSRAAKTIFKSLLRSKTKGKLPIIDENATGAYVSHFIPITKPVAQLRTNRSYRDSDIEYVKNNQFNDPSKIKI